MSNHDSGLINSNEQLRLMNKLLERKIFHLQNENQGLRERIRALTTEEDKNRLKLLLADKERRRLVKLKAIIIKDVSIFQNRVRELDAFIEEIDQGMEELVKKHGALNPSVVDGLVPLGPPRITAELNTQLVPIAESPLVLPLMEEYRMKGEDGAHGGELQQTPVSHQSSDSLADIILEKDQTPTTMPANTSKSDDKRPTCALPEKNPSQLVTTADSTEFDFEDALSYTMIPNARHERRSTLNLDQGSSFLTVAQMRPLHTSTPKNVAPRVPAVPLKTQTTKSFARPHPDKDGFVPPASRKKSDRKRHEITAQRSHSEGDSDFVLNPQATNNVTARITSAHRTADVINNDEDTIVRGDVTPEVGKENTIKNSKTDRGDSTFVTSKPHRHGNGKTQLKTPSASIRTKNSRSRETPSPQSSTNSECRRKKRAAASKVGTYKLPDLHKKLRRE